MKRWLFVCLLAACERAGDSQNPLGSGGANEPTGARAIADAGIATIPNDAAKVAVVVDAAVKPKPPKDNVAMTEDDAKAFADKLTVAGPDDDKWGDMSKRRPGGDLGGQIRDVKDGNKTVAVGGGTGRAGRVGTGGGMKIDSSSSPPGRISVASKSGGGDTSLGADAMMSKVFSAYIAGIRRCYKNLLDKDPTARGRITVTFNVDTTGRAGGAVARGFETTVDECIVRLIANWRFPVPKDKDGEATTAAFEFAMQLVPE